MNNFFDKWILTIEGKLVKHPNGPGELTNYGISQRSYPDINIEYLTESEALSIYDTDYWLKGKCNLLPENASEDGIIGKNTLLLVNNMNPNKLLQLMLMLMFRIDFYSDLKNEYFELGWYRRIIALHRYR